MAYSLKLPSRFPVGTKFVIESRGGAQGQVQVFSRHLEFPDGTFFHYRRGRCRPSSSPRSPFRAARPPAACAAARPEV